MNDGWYGALKEAIQQQQNQLVWVSEGKVRHSPLFFNLFTKLHNLSAMPLRCFVFSLEQLHQSNGGRVYLGILELYMGLRRVFLIASDSEVLPTVESPLQCYSLENLRVVT